MKLPEPCLEQFFLLLDALKQCRSLREFSGALVSLKDISLLLWALQGITDLNGKRTAPSAGGKYPLKVYLISTRVSDLDQGILKYDCHKHALTKILNEERCAAVADAAIGEQDWIKGSAAINSVGWSDQPALV